MPHKGDAAYNTGWGLEDTPPKKKDRGGQIPEITRRGYPLEEPKDITPAEPTQDVPQIEGRGYSARPNTTARGRRIQDGIKDTSGPPIKQ